MFSAFTQLSVHNNVGPSLFFLRHHTHKSPLRVVWYLYPSDNYGLCIHLLSANEHFHRISYIPHLNRIARDMYLKKEIYTLFDSYSLLQKIDNQNLVIIICMYRCHLK